MTERLDHLLTTPGLDNAIALLCAPIIPFAQGHGGLKEAFSNYVLSTTPFPELTLPLETAVSGPRFWEFASLTNVSVLLNVGPASAIPVNVGRVVNSSIYRVPGASLMPGTLLDLSSFHEKLARKIYDLRERLRRLEQMPRGWDGGSGEPFTSETVENAGRIIDLVLSGSVCVSKVPGVLLGPLQGGSLRFEWKNNNKELFITVLGNCITTQRWEPLDAIESEGYWETTLEGMQPQIEWLLA